jgi:hypothetical protein
MSIHDGFDWNDVENDVVIPEQSKIAVFENDLGNIVIREAGQYCISEDMWVVFHRRDAQRVAEAILQKAGLDMAIVPLTSLMVKNREGVLLRPFPNQDVIDKLKEVENAGRAADLVDASDERDDDQDDEDPAERKRKAAAERQRRRRDHGESHADKANERDADDGRVTTAPASTDEFDFQGGAHQALTH